MRPKARGGPPAAPQTGAGGEDKKAKRVAKEEALQPHPERKDEIQASPGKGGEDGLCCPGPGQNPSQPEKGGDSGTSSEEGRQQVDHRVGQGPSTLTFGVCEPHWCLECGKNFGQKAELEKHQLKHAGGCSYICGDCGRNFLEHVALVTGQGTCMAGNPFSHVGCPRRVLPLASSEPVVIQRKERKELSLQEKVRVLEMLEGPKVSQSELAKRFGVSQPQICRIIKNKERILAEWYQNANPGRKRKIEDKGPTGGSNSSALLQWLQRSCASANGALVQDVARRLSEGGAKPEGEPGLGWLSRIKARPAAGLEPPLLEKEKGEQIREEGWRNTILPNLLSKYDAPDVYTCGEVGLLFRVTPEDLAQERRREAAQDRLTVLLCCNMDASDKRDPLIVGDTPAPLGGLPGTGGQESLPASYRDSPKAWMTAAVFTAWLRKFNREMQSQRRNVALCLAPCAAHPLTELSNVKMVFLPPCPSWYHPLEQGIMLNFKGHYRRRRLIHLLVGVNGHGASHGMAHGSEHLSLLDATHMIVQSWLEVCPQTIMRCFQAAGFSLSPHFLAPPPVDVVQALGFQNQEQFEQFVLVDDGLECFGDQEDVEMVRKDPQPPDLISATAEEETKMMAETEGPLLPPCPTQAEVRESLAKLRHYFECHSAPLATFRAFYKMEDAVHEMWLAGKQTSGVMALGKE